MADQASSLRFLGDLSDPWVEGIADVLPGNHIRIDCPGYLLETPPEEQIVVVHRAILGATDIDCLHRYRDSGSRIVLCIGPNVRVSELERLGPVPSVVLNEATASETIVRHLSEPAALMFPTARHTLPLLAVVSSNCEVRRMLVEAAEIAGFPARGFASWDQASASPLAIWDAPVLEKDWDRHLIEPAQKRSIVAMLGFADRQTVRAARNAGAAACLDFPCDVADLEFTLDRLSRRELSSLPIDGPHLTPPPPHIGLRVVRPPVADRRELP